MKLGNIVGKSSTNSFSFLVDSQREANKFQYVGVKHKESYGVLAQIIEIEKQGDITKAYCNVLGYRDEENKLRTLRTPLEPDSEVHPAEDGFVENVLGLEKKEGAYIGVLEGREKIKVHLDLNRLITRHVAVLAKTGSGKSYTVGVLLEEILDRGIPLIIIDPHGEYNTLRHPNKNKENFEKFGVKIKGYQKQIQEYSLDVQKNPEATPLKLNAKNLTGSELMNLFPGKLSSTQIGLLYSALSDLGRSADLKQLLLNLQLEENPAKWTLITVIEYLQNLNLFSDEYTRVTELVKPGACSIINLRGTPQELQEIIVYKLLTDLFNARKNAEIPPFFLIIEEAHNFVPERTFGEVKSSAIIRQIASEGRKFGVGLAVISQRVARLEKNVISQTNTQIILKLTNPGDLRAVSTSVEGITSETEKEIRNLSIGNALVVGVVDMPLFVEVRPRKSQHGGESINLLEAFTKERPVYKTNTVSPQKTLQTEAPAGDVINVLTPRISKEEIRKNSEAIQTIRTILIPCLHLNCKQEGKEFNLLVNLHSAQLVSNFERCIGKELMALEKLSENDNKIFELAKMLRKERFSAAELFSQSGMQFKEIYETMNNLVGKGYFKKAENDFSFSDLMREYLNLERYSCREKTEFMKIEEDKKKEARVDKEVVLGLLKKFLEIKGTKECYFLKYDVEYAST